MDLPRPPREQVVAIKTRYGLTNAECRWLRRSGQFRVTRETAELVRDRWVPAAGWFYSVIVMAFCGPAMLLIAWSGAPAWKQALGSAVLAAFWLGALWCINRMFLVPWRWLRLVGARSSRP
jgi:protein-S-isoprenylcysteine O-methyltransferase Ste14